MSGPRTDDAVGDALDASLDAFTEGLRHLQTALQHRLAENDQDATDDEPEIPRWVTVRGSDMFDSAVDLMHAERVIFKEAARETEGFLLLEEAVCNLFVKVFGDAFTFTPDLEEAPLYERAHDLAQARADERAAADG